MHYLQQSANNSSFDVFIEMGSITQPPVQKFNKRKIEETFFRGVIHALFASKLVMMRRIASKQRDADIVMESHQLDSLQISKGLF